MMKMNILHIPAKKGKNGYPKISIISVDMMTEYDIIGQCGDFRAHEVHKDERQGILNVLKRIKNEIMN